jgi:hypothetical protein
VAQVTNLLAHKKVSTLMGLHTIVPLLDVKVLTDLFGLQKSAAQDTQIFRTLSKQQMELLAPQNTMPKLVD